MIIRTMLLALASCVLTSCSHDASHATVARFADPADQTLRLDTSRRSFRISTAEVEMKSLRQQVLLSGHIEPDANLTIPVNSPFSGRAEQVNAALGELVVTGQLLAKIRSDDVAQVESDLLSKILDIEAERKQNEVELTLVKANYQRRKMLFEDNIGSRADYETAEHDLEKVKAALQSLDARRVAAITTAAQRLRLFGVPAERAQQVVRSRTIDNILELRAPRGGTVTVRSLNPGQLVDNSHPVFELSDLKTVWLVAQVFESDISKIHKGMPVTAIVDSFPAKPFYGKVDYIGSRIDPQTRTLSVRATIANPHAILKPDMYARLVIETGVVNAVAIPGMSVQKVGETTVVYIVDRANLYEQRRVTLGQTIGSFVQVLTGVKPGERIVVDGSLQLHGEAIQRAAQ